MHPNTSHGMYRFNEGELIQRVININASVYDKRKNVLIVLNAAESDAGFRDAPRRSQNHMSLFTNIYPLNERGLARDEKGLIPPPSHPT